MKNEEFIPPSYEDYLRATKFARFRYKYGLIITYLAWISILLLLLSVVYYAEELSSHPMLYTTNKMNVDCYCFDREKGINYYANKTSITWTEVPIFRK